MWWQGFVIGFILGANLGFVFLALCRMAPDDDNEKAAR